MEKNRGFIGNLILIIIALTALKYFFDWSIFDAIESERGRTTITYIRNVLALVWSYLAEPANYVWKEIILPAIAWIISNVKSS